MFMKFVKGYLKFVGISWCLYGASIGVLESVTTITENRKETGHAITKNTGFRLVIAEAFKNFKKALDILVESNEE